MRNVKGKYWAYFCPAGWLQVRSIGYTKNESREFISKLESVSYKDYEKAGYLLKRIEVDIKIVDKKVK